ncbi:hypothetical protein C2845_PM13G19540 [Panicum miliaceum]|uniref:Uncharacterized protein n=1 Tax=Panicum miliaceum TaxID=4540 RepID=A0A3L6RID7_PANMI|nr:hypothetical protein C2845_PM13G19540 [Panicum miliaceum]
MAPPLDLQPGLDFQSFIWRKLGLPINIRVGLDHESFVLVVSFGRCKLHLSQSSVGEILQATLGGHATAFKVSHLNDRVFSFVVASKLVGFQVGPGPVEVEQGDDLANAPHNQVGAAQNEANADWELWPDAQPNLALNLVVPPPNLGLDLNELPAAQDMAINGGEILNPEDGDAPGEIIIGDAVIDMEVIPNVIEEEDNHVEAPQDIHAEAELVDNAIMDVPPVILGLQAPLNFPENFLVEEFPEDMLMNGEENSEEEDNMGNPVEEVPQLPQENLHLGLVEITPSYSVDPGLADFWAKKKYSQNAEATRFWANYFSNATSSQPSIPIPVEWSNFFTWLLLSPSHFSWASSFLQSKAWDLFSKNNGSIMFSIPSSCPTGVDISCKKNQEVSAKDLKVVLEQSTPPASASPKNQTQEDDSSLQRNSKTKKSEIIVDSSVRRSLRVKNLKKGFKASPCTGKNCLACDKAPPTISPSIIKNLGVDFCKIDEAKLTQDNLQKRKVKTKSVIGSKVKTDLPKKATSTKVEETKSRNKRKEDQKSDEAVVPEGVQQKQVKEKKVKKSAKDADKIPRK